MTRHSPIADWLLLAWVATLPLQTRWFLHQGRLAGGAWEYGTLSLYVTDILLVAAFVAMLFRDGGFGKRLARVPRSVVAGAVAVVLAMLVSSFNALDVGIAFGYLARALLGLAAWWAIAKSRLSFTWFAGALLFSASLESIVVLWHFIAQNVTASTLFGLAAHAPSTLGDAVVETEIGRFLRGYGTLPHPNMTAGWLAFALVIASGLYLRSKDRLERAVVLASFCLVSAALFVTFSRSGLLAWLAALIILIASVLIRERWLARPHWHFGFRRHDLPFGLKAMKLVVTSLLLLGVFFSAFAPLVKGRTDASNRLEAKSVNERVAQIDEARGIIGSYWLPGVGIGNYTKALANSYPRRDVWDYQPVHNVPLLILAEVGSIGALLILWYIGVLVSCGIREHRRRWQRASEHDIPWMAIASLGIFVLVVISMVDHYLWSLPFGMMFTWLAFGLWTKSLSDES